MVCPFCRETEVGEETGPTVCPAFKAEFEIDDKGYPTCDKSLEVLVILEEKILKNNAVDEDPLYDRFLSADRKRKVKKLEEQFFINLGLVFAIQGNHETQ